MTSVFEADTFGKGISATEIKAANRRAFESINAQPGGWSEYTLAIARRLWEEAAREAIAKALPGYWLTRAEEFEAAEAWDLARNCRRHAWLLSESDTPLEGVSEVSEVSGWEAQAIGFERWSA